MAGVGVADAVPLLEIIMDSCVGIVARGVEGAVVVVTDDELYVVG